MKKGENARGLSYGIANLPHSSTQSVAALSPVKPPILRASGRVKGPAADQWTEGLGVCRPNRIVRAHLSRGDRNRTSICVCEPNEAAITTVTPDRPSVSSIKLQPGGVTAFLFLRLRKFKNLQAYIWKNSFEFVLQFSPQETITSYTYLVICYHSKALALLLKSSLDVPFGVWKWTTQRLRHNGFQTSDAKQIN